MGIHTAALKGDGFTTYLPQPAAFLAALREVDDMPMLEDNSTRWDLHIPDEDLARRLAETGAMIAAILADDAMFISLRRAA